MFNREQQLLPAQLLSIYSKTLTTLFLHPYPQPTRASEMEILLGFTAFYLRQLYLTNTHQPSP